MRRRSFIQTLATGTAGAALLRFGTPEKPVENAHVNWTVKGFTCVTCVTCAVGLQTLLERHNGIARVAAEYPSGNVTIGFDAAVITESEIRRLVEETGFRIAEGRA